MADSKAEQAKLKAAFKQFDRNGDGVITREELRSVMDEVGYMLPEDELKAFVSQADVDNSGEITMDEFLAACHQHQTSKQQKNVAKLRRLFRSLDADGSGYITLKDLKQVLQEAGGQSMPSDELKGIILTMDRDGDRKVSFDEFAAHMTGQ